MMERIIVGYILSPYGIGGYLKVKSTSGEFEHFGRMDEVLLKKNNSERTFEIEDVQFSQSFLRIKFKGINTPEEAKKFSSSEILVPREKACPLSENEWYAYDLCQCDLVYEGSTVGSVVDVVEGGGGYLLDILLPDGSKVFVPLKDAFIGNIDIPSKTIELKHRWILEK